MAELGKTIELPHDQFDGVRDLSVEEVGRLALESEPPAPADGRYRVVNGMLHDGDGAMLGQVSDVDEEGETVTVTLGVPMPGEDDGAPAPPVPPT